MNKQLMQMVLPRLARPLYLQLQKYQTGQLSDLQFSENFEELLQRQHHWLSQKGISAAKAAMTIHAAVLVLSQPGLKAEEEEYNLPFEVVEYRPWWMPPATWPRTTGSRNSRTSASSRPWWLRSANNVHHIDGQRGASQGERVHLYQTGHVPGRPVALRPFSGHRRRISFPDSLHDGSCNSPVAD